jgi:hypothetical protein
MTPLIAKDPRSLNNRRTLHVRLSVMIDGRSRADQLLLVAGDNESVSYVGVGVGADDGVGCYRGPRETEDELA